MTVRVHSNFTIEAEEAQRRQIMADNRGHGRLFNTKTTLGQMMLARGWRKYDICGAAKISDRAMTNYLAGKRISVRHLLAIADVFGCEPEDIQPPLRHLS